MLRPGICDEFSNIHRLSLQQLQNCFEKRFEDKAGALKRLKLSSGLPEQTPPSKELEQHGVALLMDSTQGGNSVGLDVLSTSSRENITIIIRLRCADRAGHPIYV
jgi:hypothetical protein